jgi:predicted RNA binding protein YcfA (HicA-like mRNA interferase family)
MAKLKKLIDKLMRGAPLSFRELEQLLISLGFSLERVAGSHHIYVHPDANRPISIQPDGKEAKRYQLRQLRDMIVEFNLLDPE